MPIHNPLIFWFCRLFNQLGALSRQHNSSYQAAGPDGQSPLPNIEMHQV